MSGEGINKARMEAIVLEAIRTTNLARHQQEQLDVAPTAPLYGPDSPLDSLGLVGLLIDIEEALLVEGFEVSLNDERAMSQQHSPFRNVPTLVEYIHKLLATTTV